MSKVIRVGSRSSRLAVWQAKHVVSALQDLGYAAELILIDSEGDTNLAAPVYEIGITGLFTRHLDSALLVDKVDIAVHSLKDVPTLLAKGIALGAVMERGPSADVLVRNKNTKPSTHSIIATGSLRRKAQWLNRFPQDEIVPLRGNIDSRLLKLYNSEWHGAIFAQCALERLAVENVQFEILDWMMHSPAQGAVGVCCREQDHETFSILRQINHIETQLCVDAERKVMQVLQAGCSLPVGVKALLHHEQITISAEVLSVDGKEKLTESIKGLKDQSQSLATQLGKLLLQQGAGELLSQRPRPNHD
ncbi:MAG TPA: hydroxymethylbilane synthase [Cyclobacteriaceae bacterium]|jgi:hydroxymethylbilane synthase|nr:hydroxymethylbilane synthase [Cyclobacteriaceae bacterium]